MITDTNTEDFSVCVLVCIQLRNSLRDRTDCSVAQLYNTPYQCPMHSSTSDAVSGAPTCRYIVYIHVYAMAIICNISLFRQKSITEMANIMYSSGMMK